MVRWRLYYWINGKGDVEGVYIYHDRITGRIGNRNETHCIQAHCHSRLKGASL